MQTNAATKRDRSDDFGNGGQAQGGERPAPPVFIHFVDLFDKVSPKFDMERAVTAAYWFQELQNQGSWQAQSLRSRRC
jgi:hypothetical protein